MLGLTSDMRFRLYVPPCDMRKGFNGLEALVANDMQEPPMSGAVYVFLNRRGDRIIKEQPHSDEEIIALRSRSRRLLELGKPKLEALLLQNRKNAPLVDAIKYTLKQWGKLLLYTEHARMEIDNNAIENSIRPVAVGRKNYLFAGSEESAQIIAQVYSFFAICKVHDVNPRLWLTDVLARFRSTKPSMYQELLPHKWKPHGDPNAELSDYYFLNQADPTENSQS